MVGLLDYQFFHLPHKLLLLAQESLPKIRFLHHGDLGVLLHLMITSRVNRLGSGSGNRPGLQGRPQVNVSTTRLLTLLLLQGRLADFRVEISTVLALSTG